MVCILGKERFTLHKKEETRYVSVTAVLIWKEICISFFLPLSPVYNFLTFPYKNLCFPCWMIAHLPDHTLEPILI